MPFKCQTLWAATDFFFLSLQLKWHQCIAWARESRANYLIGWQFLNVRHCLEKVGTGCSQIAARRTHHHANRSNTDHWLEELLSNVNSYFPALFYLVSASIAFPLPVGSLLFLLLCLPGSLFFLKKQLIVWCSLQVHTHRLRERKVCELES